MILNDSYLAIACQSFVFLKFCGVRSSSCSKCLSSVWVSWAYNKNTPQQSTRHTRNHFICWSFKGGTKELSSSEPCWIFCSFSFSSAKFDVSNSQAIVYYHNMTIKLWSMKCRLCDLIGFQHNRRLQKSIISAACLARGTEPSGWT